jgi:undecaprenyl-diphosphatase
MTRSFRRAILRLLHWIGSHELAVLLALGGVAGGAGLFLVIASEVSEGETLTLDRKLLLSMRKPDLSPKGSPQVAEIMRDCTALGGITMLSLLTLSTAGFLVLSGKKHMAGFLCCSILGGLLLSLALKGFYHRPRPNLVPWESAIMTTSFPSGHSMLSALTYLTLGALLARSYTRNRLKAYFLGMAAFLSAMVGVSRVYLGVHWPTDVLAGWTAGATWAVLCWLVARWLQRRKQLEGPV